MESTRTCVTIFTGAIVIFLIVQFTSVQSGVTTFRVYNEKRILNRLASAPLVSANKVQFSHRSGVHDQMPPKTPLSDGKERRRKRKKRIRKIIRKRPTSTTTHLTTAAQDFELEQINPLNNYNNRDIEIYDRRRTRRKRPRQGGPKESSDLQRAESGNPFVNSTAPISSDFAGDGGLRFHLQILHPLLNEDSVLSHHEPKVPENKTVKILHQLSDEVAGEIPVAPDLKKIRRKHPLQNPDSVISGQTQVSKNEPTTVVSSNSRRREEADGKARNKNRQSTTEKTRKDNVTFVQPYNVRQTSTTYPPVTSKPVVSTSRPRSPKTTTTTTTSTTTTTTAPTTVSTTVSTTARPTIRLTNPPLTIETITTTSTERPSSTIILSPLAYTPTAIPNQSLLDNGNPQVIIFPPEDTAPHLTTAGIGSTTAISPEQEILNQLLGLGQPPSPSGNNLQRPGQPSSIGGNNNFFDLFNLFQSTTPLNQLIPTTTTPRPYPAYPASTTTRRTTTQAPKPSSTTPTPVTIRANPTQSQAQLDNLLQLSLLEGLLQGNLQGSGQQPGAVNQNDLTSLLALLGTQTNVVQRPPVVQTTLPPPTPTSPTSLQAALSNMLSVLTNPFGQQQRRTPQPPQQSTSVFGNGGNIFQGSRNVGGAYGGGGESIFSGGNGGVFGGNSLFNLSPGASSQRTTVVPNPSTTPSTANSENDILKQLIQLGIDADQGEKKHSTQPKVSKKPPPGPSSASALDIQSILSQNWRGHDSSPIQSPGATHQPSETMQLLNVLFNNNNPTPRPSGPYWWLDMNAFMGKDQNAHAMAGVRPKLGQREYFIKVRR